eukprot:1183378-Prorocentrum_minimum.AAC.1
MNTRPTTERERLTKFWPRGEIGKPKSSNSSLALRDEGGKARQASFGPRVIAQGLELIAQGLESLGTESSVVSDTAVSSVVDAGVELVKLARGTKSDEDSLARHRSVDIGAQVDTSHDAPRQFYPESFNFTESFSFYDAQSDLGAPGGGGRGEAPPPSLDAFLSSIIVGELNKSPEYASATLQRFLAEDVSTVDLLSTLSSYTENFELFKNGVMVNERKLSPMFWSLVDLRLGPFRKLQPKE